MVCYYHGISLEGLSKTITIVWILGINLIFLIIIYVTVQVNSSDLIVFNNRMINKK